MSDLEQIDLKHLIEQHPEVLTDHTKLKAYILDLYPNCKRGMVNILVAIQQCGIVAEMQASKHPAALDMSRWKKCLEDDVGFTGALAETCLEMWCSAIGIQEKEKAKGTATSISPELQNSQKDWFEYDGTTLLRLKEEYQKYDGAIYVPYGVESIGKSAFKGCRSLTSIAIPDSVESIGDNAFWGCTGLTSITIPDSVESIGGHAFRNCTGLTSITIPDSVESIGSFAFDRCSGLTSIKVASRNAAYHSQGNCVIETANKVLVLGCKTSTIPDDGSVTSIGDYAFYDCTGLTSITIPDSVYSIGDFAFRDCTGLTSIAIPDSVESIGDYAFRGCSGLTSIKVASRNAAYHSQGNCVIETANKVLVLGCKTSTIPDDGSVTSIGDFAFCGCTGLTSIAIPDSVDSIGFNAFCDCTGLTSITIPDSVESIGDNAFWGCTGLTSITIPDSVYSIGDFAFRDCTGLTSITIPDSVESIGDSAFWGCDGLTSIAIPDSVDSIGESAFDGCSSLTSITIPDSVTKIEQYVFNECQSLEKIIFQGTKAQWKAIEKYDEWNLDTGSYVVHCTDGDISKNES